MAKEFKEAKNYKKVIFGLLLLVLTTFLILESSFAFFSDYISSIIGATTGTVNLKPIALLINGDDKPVTNWKPGDVSTIEWTIENGGNKSVYTRNTLEIVWDVEEDISELGVIYLYPATMSDEDIRTDIALNNAINAIGIGDDQNNIKIGMNERKGYIYEFLGNVLDGVGSGAEISDSRTPGAEVHNLPDGTNSQIIRLKLAFSLNASIAFQNLPVYVNVTSDATQFRNNLDSSLRMAKPIVYLPFDDIGSSNMIPFLKDKVSDSIFVITGGTITANTSQFKIGTQSAYFSGASGQRINENITELNLGTDDFTISMWLYQEAQSSVYSIVFSHENNSYKDGLRLFTRFNSEDKILLYLGESLILDTNVTPSFNVWTHYAVVRKDGIFTVYQNGNSIGNSLDTYSNRNVDLTNLSISGNDYGSASYKGYIDDFAIYSSAKWDSNFIAPIEAQVDADLAYLDFETGETNSGEKLAKDAISNTYFDILGNATIIGNSKQKRIGEASIYFSGTAGQRINKNISKLSLGTNNFTISMWLRPEPQITTYSVVFGHETNNLSDSLRFFTRYDSENKIAIYLGSTEIIAIDVVPHFNVWTHYAIVRKDGIFTIYENGRSLGSSLDTYNNRNVDLSSLSIGGNNFTGAPYRGYIDDFAIFDYVIWNRNFTPPIAPLIP